jgi:hypothetical protein
VILAHDGSNGIDCLQVGHSSDRENTEAKLTFSVEVDGDQIRLSFWG